MPLVDIIQHLKVKQKVLNKIHLFNHCKYISVLFTCNISLFRQFFQVFYVIKQQLNIGSDIVSLGAQLVAAEANCLHSGMAS